MNRVLLGLLTLVPTAALAQSVEVEGKLEGGRETTTTAWYASPWTIAIVLGVILLLVLLGSAFRRRGDDHTTIIKT